MSTDPDNARRSSLVTWLAGGALAVVIVLYAGNRLIQQRALDSAAKIVQIHAEADPIVRGSADLGAAIQDIANVVTSALQSTATAQNVAPARVLIELSAAEQNLNAARTALSDVEISAPLASLLDSLPAEGAALLRLDFERRASVTAYSRAVARLRDRVSNAGGDGIWVGEQNVARRSLVELAAAVNDLQSAAMAGGSAAIDLPASALPQAEQQLRALDGADA
jgi:hypothetical protein